MTANILAIIKIHFKQMCISKVSLLWNLLLELLSMWNDIPYIEAGLPCQCILFDTVEIESTQKSVTSIAQSQFIGHPSLGGGNAHICYYTMHPTWWAQLKRSLRFISIDSSPLWRREICISVIIRCILRTGNIWRINSYLKSKIWASSRASWSSGWSSRL